MTLRQGRGIRTLVSVLVVATAFGALEVAARRLEPHLPVESGWPHPLVAAKATQLQQYGPEDFNAVIAGTSMANVGIDPAVLEEATGGSIRAWNAALAGGTAPVHHDWLLDLVVPTLEPDVVYYGMQTIDVIAASSEPVLQQRWRTARHTKSGPLSALERWAAEHSALTRQRGHLREPSTVIDSVDRWRRGEPGPQVRDPWPASRLAPTGHDPGRRGQRLDYEPRELRVVRRLIDAGFVVDTDALRALASIADELEADGRELVLVILPVPAVYVALHDEGPSAMTRFRRIVEDLAARKGLRILDLAPGGSPDGLFADANHLNDRGAIAATTMLADLESGWVSDAEAHWRQLATAAGVDVTTGRLAGQPAPELDANAVAILQDVRARWPDEANLDWPVHLADVLASS